MEMHSASERCQLHSWVTIALREEGHRCLLSSATKAAQLAVIVQLQFVSQLRGAGASLAPWPWVPWCSSWQLAKRYGCSSDLALSSLLRQVRLRSK